MKIDHEQVKGLELMHIRIDCVVPLNVIGLYIDVESRLNKDEVQCIMNKLTTLSDEMFRFSFDILEKIFTIFGLMVFILP